jgi:hypothetical protein
MEQYVILALEFMSYNNVKYFDLWMFTFKHDMFALVINFINSQWVLYHVTMGLFETIDIIRVAMAM